MLSSVLRVLFALALFRTTQSWQFKGNEIVKVLTEEELRVTVIDSDIPQHMVFFWRRNCGGCAGTSEWFTRACSELKAEGVSCYAIEAPRYPNLINKFNIRGFPTYIGFFGKGPPEGVRGLGNWETFVKFAKGKLKKIHGTEGRAKVPAFIEATIQPGGSVKIEKRAAYDIDDPHADHAQQAVNLDNQGNQDDAYASLKAAIKFKPDSYKNWYNIAVMEYELLQAEVDLSESNDETVINQGALFLRTRMIASKACKALGMFEQENDAGANKELEELAIELCADVAELKKKQPLVEVGQCCR